MVPSAPDSKLPNKTLLLCLILCLLVSACDTIEDYFDDDDDGSATSGSGEISAGTTTTEATPDQGSSAGTKIYLDAFKDFSCSGNWADRDGALGLKPFSGSGSCSAVFPGKAGTYRIHAKIQTEFDGQSPYSISINDQVIKQGEYPLSSSLFCDCPKDDWRSICPDKNVTIDCGTHTLAPGDAVEFWGDDVYPCGDHGSYAKWHGITFTLVN